MTSNDTSSGSTNSAPAKRAQLDIYVNKLGPILRPLDGVPWEGISVIKRQTNPTILTHFLQILYPEKELVENRWHDECHKNSVLKGSRVFFRYENYCWRSYMRRYIEEVGLNL
jgi:hypothetical protein